MDDNNKAPQALPLSQGVLALLRSIAAGAGYDDTFSLLERGGEDHRTEHRLPMRQVRASLVPAAVLKVLERSTVPHSVATLQYGPGDSGAVTQTAVVATSRHFEPVPGRGCWLYPVDAINTWLATLPQPTGVIYAGPTITAWYALSSPVAPAVGHDVAMALGCDPAQAALVPLPGSNVPGGSPRVVYTAALNDVTYDANELKKAAQSARKVA